MLLAATVRPACSRRVRGGARAGSHLRAVLRRAVERRIARGFVGNRDLETGLEVGDLVLVELLLLVADVAAFAGLAETVALDGVGEDQGRFALGLDACL